MTSYTPIRCCECDQILNGKIQVYHERKVYCENCNLRVNKLEEVVKVINTKPLSTVVHSKL